MDEPVSDQIEYLEFLRRTHLEYMRQQIESFYKLNSALDAALTDKISELKLST